MSQYSPGILCPNREPSYRTSRDQLHRAYRRLRSYSPPWRVHIRLGRRTAQMLWLHPALDLHYPRRPEEDSLWRLPSIPGVCHLPCPRESLDVALQEDDGPARDPVSGPHPLHVYGQSGRVPEPPCHGSPSRARPRLRLHCCSGYLDFLRQSSARISFGIPLSPYSTRIEDGSS